MDKTIANLTALVMTASLPSLAPCEYSDSCVPLERVCFVADKIPESFTETRPGVYLIELVAEAEGKSEKAGQLTVYMPQHDPRFREGPNNDPNFMSIFDRTSRNPDAWYNVCNKKGEQAGCAEPPVISLTKGNPHRTDPDKAQELFAKFINKVYRMLGGQ